MSKFIAASAAGDPPDLLRSDIAWVPQLAAEGIAAQPEQPDVVRDHLEGGASRARCRRTYYKGSYYGIPADTNTQVLFWNKADFAAAGSPGRRPPMAQLSPTRQS